MIIMYYNFLSLRSFNQLTKYRAILTKMTTFQLPIRYVRVHSGHTHYL